MEPSTTAATFVPIEFARGEAIPSNSYETGLIAPVDMSTQTQIEPIGPSPRMSPRSKDFNTSEVVSNMFLSERYLISSSMALFGA